MNRGFYIVIIAQTFSSLADNALFIAAIALIHQLEGPVWVPPLIKWGVAASYVLLAPFVGAIADAYAKGKVMFTTNAFKVIGCILMFSYGFDRQQLDRRHDRCINHYGVSRWRPISITCRFRLATFTSHDQANGKYACRSCDLDD